MSETRCKLCGSTHWDERFTAACYARQADLNELRGIVADLEAVGCEPVDFAKVSDAHAVATSAINRQPGCRSESSALAAVAAMLEAGWRPTK